MPDVLKVVAVEGECEDAVQSANDALDVVVGWFVDDGFTDEDILDRVGNAIEHNRDTE